MTVPDDDWESTQFADGSTLVFDFSFRMIEPTHMIAVNITTGLTLEYGTDYTVEINSNGVGGTITLVDPQDDGDELHFYRLQRFLQTLDLITQQDLKAEVIEEALDFLTILTQQLRNDFRFIADVTIPGLEALITSIVNGLLQVLGPGGSRSEGAIPVWTSDATATLSSGILPTGVNHIIRSSDGLTWESGPIVTVSLGALVVPGVTNINGLPYWTVADGSAMGTIPAGDDGEVLAGVTAGAPDFRPVLEVIGDLTSTAGHVLTSNGTGVDASFQAVPASAPLAPSFFSPTSRPTGLKYWGLGSPGAYAVGTRRPATVSGTQTNTADTEGALLTLTTTAALNNDVKVYTKTDDVAATRNALPIWITRLKTGASVAAIRIWAGFNFNQLNAMRASGVATDSTAAFRYDTGVDGTAFWRCVTNTGADVATTTTTTVAVTANTSYILAVDMSEDGHVKFLIDGVEVADHTTNLPDAGDELDWLIICRTLAAAVKSISIGPVNMSHR